MRTTRSRLHDRLRDLVRRQEETTREIDGIITQLEELQLDNEPTTQRTGLDANVRVSVVLYQHAGRKGTIISRCKRRDGQPSEYWYVSLDGGPTIRKKGTSLRVLH